MRADVSDPEQAAGFVERAARELGEPDTLVCNAGIALPHFIRRQKGAIVTIGSMWGQVGGSCEVAYSAAKGAVIAFTKALAKEVGPSGIRVNCVSPGVIDTEMNGHLSRSDLQALAEEIPLGRVGIPYEVARCVRYLCSDGSEYITGQVIAPNGGIVI